MEADIEVGGERRCTEAGRTKKKNTNAKRFRIEPGSKSNPGAVKGTQASKGRLQTKQKEQF